MAQKSLISVALKSGTDAARGQALAQVSLFFSCKQIDVFSKHLPPGAALLRSCIISIDEPTFCQPIQWDEFTVEVSKCDTLMNLRVNEKREVVWICPDAAEGELWLRVGGKAVFADHISLVKVGAGSTEEWLFDVVNKRCVVIRRSEDLCNFVKLAGDHMNFACSYEFYAGTVSVQGGLEGYQDCGSDLDVKYAIVDAARNQHVEEANVAFLEPRKMSRMTFWQEDGRRVHFLRPEPPMVAYRLGKRSTKRRAGTSDEPEPPSPPPRGIDEREQGWMDDNAPPVEQPIEVPSSDDDHGVVAEEYSEKPTKSSSPARAGAIKNDKVESDSEDEDHVDVMMLADKVKKIVYDPDVFFSFKQYEEDFARADAEPQPIYVMLGSDSYTVFASKIFREALKKDYMRTLLVFNCQTNQYSAVALYLGKHTDLKIGAMSCVKRNPNSMSGTNPRVLMSFAFCNYGRENVNAYHHSLHETTLEMVDALPVRDRSQYVFVISSKNVIDKYYSEIREWFRVYDLRKYTMIVSLCEEDVM